MRVLVISDSHKKEWVINDIINRHSNINTVLFLGDGAKEFLSVAEKYPQKNFLAVCGNNDSAFLGLNYQESLTLEGVRILLTHGHLFNVNYGTDNLIKIAKELNYKIVLYGHTHIPEVKYIDGIYCVNPGSVSRSRNGTNTYAVIDILKSGIFPIIMNV